MRSPGAEPPLSIRLFGPFQVCLYGRPLPRLSFRKAPSVLALLALRPGCGVEREWLAALLWPDATRSSGLHSLRKCLADLRRALGPEAGRLRSPSARTLSLDLTGAFVDVALFDAALARGGVEALEEGVALYRGPLLEGCAEEWVFQERQFREQEYLGARETLAAHGRAQGDLAGAEEHLGRALVVDPTRERAQRSLMEVLAGGGNYSAALVAYRDLRLRLHQEMNSEPDPETHALFLRLRAEARGKAAGSVDLGEEGNGLTGSKLRAVQGRETPAPHLPLPLTRFIGREREIVALRQQLAASRLVTLTGSGGCGKTRLAIEVARGLAGAYPDGVRFVEFAPLADPDLVPQRVAAALGVREEPERSLVESLVKALVSQQILLLLDNCEHLVAACAHLVESLLQACPHVSILATSRESLGIAGEQSYRVPSLSLPKDSDQWPEVSGQLEGKWTEPGGPGETHEPSSQQLATDLWPLTTAFESEAVRLFSERAATARPGFALTAGNVAAVTQICRRLDGIPLALEMAAARLSALPVEQLVRRLDDMFSVLTGGSRTALPRHRTLRALIDWSYDLLTEPEQALLRRLAVFAGGCTLEAAESVVSGQWSVVSDAETPCQLATDHWPLTTDEILDLLTRLVEKSLVLYEEREGEGRYRLLEMIREYARDRLAAGGEREALRERHAEYFLALAQTAGTELRRADAGRWLDRLEREHDNLRAALAWSVDTDHPMLGLQLAHALAGFWRPRGYFREAREQLQRLLAHPDLSAPTAARAQALRITGRFTVFPEGAKALFEESLAICCHLEDRAGIAAARLDLGYAAWSSWDLITARSLAEHSLGIRRELSDRRGTAEALMLLSNILRQGIDRPAARAHADAAVAIWRELDDPVQIALGLDVLACAVRDLGDYDAARPIFEEALAAGRELGDKLRIASAGLGLGGVLFEIAELPVARVVLEESLSAWRELDEREFILQALSELGLLRRAQGDAEPAYALFQEMRALSQEANRSNYLALSFVNLAGAAADLGRWDECATYAATALRMRRAGEVHADQTHIAWSLTALARAALAAGSPARAARLLGATDAWRHARDNECASRELDRATPAVRAQMDAAEFAAAWAAGHAAPIEQIIAEALGEGRAEAPTGHLIPSYGCVLPYPAIPIAIGASTGRQLKRAP